MLSLDGWLARFSDELRRLQPGISSKLAWSAGLQQYDPAADPTTAALRYHEARTRYAARAPHILRTQGR
jgi:hypothetical protein